MLCGDEVRAAVVDVGSAVSKFGTAGEDHPRHVFRSEVGHVLDDDGMAGKATKAVVGNVRLRYVRDNVAVESVVRPDGTVNYDDYEALLRHGLEDCMRVDPTEYPLMMSNSNHHDFLKSSEKMMELAFEGLGSPAAYVGTAGMLSSFSAGRPTSLVVDFGAREVRIVPVVDGYTINRAVVTTRRGGDWVDHAVRREIEAAGVTIQPWFAKGCSSGSNGSSSSSSSSSSSNSSGNSSSSSSSSNNNGHGMSVTPSFREAHVKDVVRDVKRWMSFVPYKTVEATYRESFMAGLTLPPYELPDGTMIRNSEALCTAAERLFVPVPDTQKRLRTPMGSMASPSSSSSSSSSSASSSSSSAPLVQGSWPLDLEADSLQELVHASLARCDVDARRDLLSNIVVVGGASLIDGVPQRLSHELTELLPSTMKVKVITPSPLERQFAGWIGGSILSICGSFQQLWISKSEYSEFGATLFQHRLMH